MKFKRTNSFWISLLVLVLTSCEKDEQPIEIEEESVEQENIPGDKITASVFIDNDYKYQVFYHLETNTEVAQNLTTAWDLAFECGNNEHHIKLNSSKGMLVSATGQTNFADVKSKSGVKWIWDNPNGLMDSTAIGDWGVKNGKTNLNNHGEEFRLRVEIEEESERERRNKKAKTKHVS